MCAVRFLPLYRRVHLHVLVAYVHLLWQYVRFDILISIWQERVCN